MESIYSNSQENTISFICIYEVKDYNEVKIINNVNSYDIKSKIKILNGNKKENLVFKKRFNEIGIGEINFIIEGELNNMSFMFKDCPSLIQIAFNSIDTRKVVKMASMFQGCENLEYLDLSNFNTSNVTNMFCMFSSCSKLK